MENINLIKKYPSNWSKELCEKVKLLDKEEQIKMITRCIKPKIRPGSQVIRQGSAKA